MAKKLLAENGLEFRRLDEQTKRIDELHQRAKRCICKYCGHELTLRKITYAAYDEAKIELYCEQCGRIEIGVEPEVYKMAEYYVDAMKYDHYMNLDDSTNKRRMNIALICDILTWGFKNSSMLTKEGFTVDVKLDEDLMGEAFSLSDTFLNSLNKG